MKKHKQKLNPEEKTILNVFESEKLRSIRDVKPEKTHSKHCKGA